MPHDRAATPAAGGPPGGLSLAAAGLRSSRGADDTFRVVLGAFALLVIVLVFGIGFSLAMASGPSLQKFGLSFLWTSKWDPVHDTFGALPFIYGTLVTSALALLIGVPVSLGVAIYLAEMSARGSAVVLSFIIELLAAIPSVILGLWGIFVLIPWVRGSVEPALGRALGWTPLFSGPAYGIGMLAAGIILAIMVIPIISSVARDVMLAVPQDQREAMYALGATRWEMIRGAVLPYGRAGIIGAVILGLGRALGETMAVTMVIGNRPQIVASLFQPGYTIAAALANEFSEASSSLYLSALIEMALVLFVMSLLVNAAARRLVSRVTSSVIAP